MLSINATGNNQIFFMDKTHSDEENEFRMCIFAS